MRSETSQLQRRIYSFDLFADHFQFYLEDEATLPDPSALFWAGSAMDDLVDTHPGAIAIATVRNMFVRVTVEISDEAPDDDFGEWDQVTDASLDVPSGRIVVAGCTEDRPDAARIPVAPGTYRVRAYYGGLDSVEDELAPEGDDRYRAVLWPGEPQAPQVLKRWPQPWRQAR